MAHYVVHKPAHVTFYVAIVEAENEEQAREAASETDGIGYFDADWDEGVEVVYGPFPTLQAAEEADESWTEGSF